MNVVGDRSAYRISRNRPEDVPDTVVSSTTRSHATLTDLAILALAPVAAFFVLRVRPMYNFDSVDANIYTGYSHNGPDMMLRFGPDVYYWVRLGAILPERLAYLAFGSVPGFYALRYALVLLITVPLFFVVRAAQSRSAAWLCVSLFLTSPVMYVALGSDYPDSVIFGYLGGAFALLFMPLRSTWARLAARGGAGVLLALSLHSQVVVAPTVAALLMGFAVASWRRGRVRSLLGDVLSVGIGAIGVTGVVMLVARLWLGHTNIFRPTLVNYASLQQPNQLALWHSRLPDWAVEVPYIAVPAVVALGWVVAVAVTRAGRITRVEVGAGLWLLLATTAAYAMQFAGNVATLEYRLYSSSLWPPTLIVLGLLVVRLVDAPRRAAVDVARHGVLIVVVVVWAVAVLASFGVLSHRTGSLRNTLVISAVLVALAGAALLRRPVVRVALASTVVLGLMFLTVSPTTKVDGPGFSVLPAAHYDLVLGAAADRDDVAYYEMATQTPPLVGPATAPGRIPIFWASRTVPPRMLNASSGTYIWWRFAPGIPSGAETGTLLNDMRTLRPSPLMLLTMSEAETQEMLAFLSRWGLHPKVVNTGDMEGEGTTIRVSAVEIS